MALDDLSGPRIAKKMENQAREMRTMGTETEATGRKLDSAEKSMGNVERRLGTMTQKTKDAHLQFGVLGKVLTMMRWPAIIAGIGGVIQALGGLTAGAVGLLPKLTDLSALGAGAATTYLGFGQAMAVAKFATQGLSQALAGNKRAIAALTPDARAFLQTLRQFHPVLQSFRGAAQNGLFPGLGGLLGSVRQVAPQIRGIIGNVAGDMGNLGGFLGKQLSAPGFMTDLASLSDQSSRSFGAAAQGAFYFAHAVEQVLIAAQPFTDWLGSSIVHLAKLADQEAMIGRATGSLGDYFDRAKHSIQTLADVGKNVFGGLRGVLEAARGSGDSLWGSIDRISKRFNDWTNSVTGQAKMRQWFQDMKPVLSATVGLFGALAKAIGSLSTGPQGAVMLNALKDAVPALATGIKTITASLGPPVVNAFAAVIHLLGDLAGSAGPLALVAGAIGTTAHAVDVLVRALGPLGPAIASAIGSFALLSKMGVFGLLGARGAASGAVTAAETVAGGAVAAKAAAATGGVAAGTEGAAAAAGGAGLLAKFGGLGGLGSKALGVAGKFALPLLGVQALLGALGTQGGLSDRLQGAASAVTFGLIPRPTTAAEIAAAAAAAAAPATQLPYGSVASQRRSIASIRNQAGQLQQRIVAGENTPVRGRSGLTYADPNSPAVRQMRLETQDLQAELKKRQGLLAWSQQQIVQQLDAASVKNAEFLVNQYSQAFGILKGPMGPRAAMDQTIGESLKSMRRMRPAGAKVLGDSMLEWVRVQSQNNPRLKGEYDKLVAGIESSFSDLHRHVVVVNGQILTGSTKEWNAIRDALITPVEQAREQVTKGFTAIEQQAIGSLQAMGYTRSQAASLVGNVVATNQGAKNINVTGFGAQHGGRNETGGRLYRLPGTGTLDTVPMADGGYGAPGELVVNRWSERDINRDLTSAGKPSLEQRVRSETRPHYSFGGLVTSTMAGSTTGQAAAPGAANWVAQQHPELHAGIASAVQSVLDRFPLSITSTTRGGHAGGSYHYLGEAADIAGSSGTMNAAAQWIKGSGLASSLTEGIHNPGLSVKFGRAVPSSFWGPAVWGEHANHIHMAVAGALQALAAGSTMMNGFSPSQISPLKAPGTSLRGIPGAMVTRAGQMEAAGLTHKLNAALGLVGGGGPGGGAGAAAPAQVRDWVIAGLRLAGVPTTPANVAAQIRLTMGESGGNPSIHQQIHDVNSVNGSGGALGFAQMLQSTFNAYEVPGHGDIFNPIDNTAASALYQLARYGHLVGHPGYTLGGRMGAAPAWGGWHAKGTDVMVNRPTVFGAGEAGPERVRISPAAGGGAVTIQRGAVQVNAAGGNPAAIERYVDRRLLEFAEEIAREIEHGAEESTHGALR